jgi:hypothetical protein
MLIGPRLEVNHQQLHEHLERFVSIARLLPDLTPSFAVVRVGLHTVAAM